MRRATADASRSDAARRRREVERTRVIGIGRIETTDTGGRLRIPAGFRRQASSTPTLGASSWRYVRAWVYSFSLAQCSIMSEGFVIEGASAVADRF